MSKESETINLFKHILKVCKSHGIHKVDVILRQLEIHGLGESETELIEAIIARVTAIYQINRKDLFNTFRTRTCSEARKMCYILIRTHLEMSHSKIALYFNRNNRVVYRAIEDYKTMNVSIKWQREFIKNCQVVDIEISAIKNRVMNKKIKHA